MSSRRRKVRSTLAVLTALCACSSAAAEDWVCVPQKSTGFKFSANTWNSVDFNVDGQSFVVSEVPTREQTGGVIGIEVRETGVSYLSHTCPPFRDGAAQVTCGGLGMGFVFNRETLRFQEIYGIGFVGEGDGEGNTPYITIGTCTKLPSR